MTYRSIKIVEELKDKQLKYPICVPTYSRPMSEMLKVYQRYPELPIIFFIRKEQKKLYQPLMETGAKVVFLTKAYCAGSTRRAICNWAHRKGHEHIFMFDDRVRRVSILAPRQSRTGRWNMGTVKETTIVDAMRLWEYLIDFYRPIISGGAHSGFTFDMANAGATPKFYGADVQIAIHLNIAELFRHNIEYQDDAFCGSDDATINFHILSAGLPYMIFPDLEYDCEASRDNNGGQAAVEGGTRIERFTKYCDRFLTNISGKDHPGVRVRKDKTGVPYIRFNWSYWRKTNGDKGGNIEPCFGEYQRV